MSKQIPYLQEWLDLAQNGKFEKEYVDESKTIVRQHRVKTSRFLKLDLL